MDTLILFITQYIDTGNVAIKANDRFITIPLSEPRYNVVKVAQEDKWMIENLIDESIGDDEYILKALL